MTYTQTNSSTKTIHHKFVKNIPEKLEDGILYISVEFASAIHKCCCGCGNEVVTPISSIGWTLIFDGKTITLDPSIGNWGLPCKSHYWIINSKIVWSRKWSNEEIKILREQELKERKDFFKSRENESNSETKNYSTRKEKKKVWKKIKNWFSFKKN